MAHQTVELKLNQIIPGDNDRSHFDTEGLRELASSIKEHGLAQPITVRPLNGHYQIVAGERRYRAHVLLNAETIPAIIRDLDDEAASAIMLAENVSRRDLDPIDEALAYQKRLTQFDWSVEDIAQRAGVTTVRVHFRLKLLRLRPDVQKLIRDGQLQLGYAQILSDADLDTNRQLIALRRLRDNPRPTPTWFRREVNALREEQCQETLFDTSFFTVQAPEAAAEAYSEPAHPETTAAPRVGRSLQDIIGNQVKFWQSAAEEWDRLGKPFKRQECQAAAAALAALI
jgi:ParB/RepB/Spo0J family partition protein